MFDQSEIKLLLAFETAVCAGTDGGVGGVEGGGVWRVEVVAGSYYTAKIRALRETL